MQRWVLIHLTVHRYFLHETPRKFASLTAYTLADSQTLADAGNVSQHCGLDIEVSIVA